MPLTFDVVVIGGGIHGVGAAQAVAAVGYSVAVLEQRELAWGTSSRSSKLIHGGLRYLESGQFSVVRECLHERALLTKLAPELVTLTPFYIPIYQNTSRRAWQIRSGLSLYAILAGFSEGAGFRKLAKAEWSDLDGLEQEGLQAVFQYWDGQTDDAALTRAVMASASQLGAALFQPARFLGAEVAEQGVTLRAEINGQRQQMVCRAVINAAGPWVNQVLGLITPQPATNQVDLVQGSHLILDMPLGRGVYYMESPIDRRAIFAIPWKGKTMLGTTEKVYQGDPAKVMVTAEERDYLLNTLQHYFPQTRSVLPDELASFAGLRVLPHSDESAFGRSRETVLLWNDPHLRRVLSIYGGKLTAYRATAERVVEQLQTVLPPRQRIADTRKLLLKP